MASSQAADHRAGLARRRAMNVRRHPWDRWAPGVPARLPVRRLASTPGLCSGAGAGTRATGERTLRRARLGCGPVAAPMGGRSAFRPLDRGSRCSRTPGIRRSESPSANGRRDLGTTHECTPLRRANPRGVWRADPGMGTAMGPECRHGQGTSPVTEPHRKDPLRGVDARVRDEGRNDREAVQALRRIDRSDGAARTARDAVEPGVQRFFSRRAIRARTQRAAPEGTCVAAAVDQAALSWPSP
jgi:hypothetical protein